MRSNASYVVITDKECGHSLLCDDFNRRQPLMEIVQQTRVALTVLVSINRERERERERERDKDKLTARDIGISTYNRRAQPHER